MERHAAIGGNGLIEGGIDRSAAIGVRLDGGRRGTGIGGTHRGRGGSERGRRVRVRGDRRLGPRRRNEGFAVAGRADEHKDAHEHRDGDGQNLQKNRAARGPTKCHVRATIQVARTGVTRGLRGHLLVLSDALGLGNAPQHKIATGHLSSEHAKDA